MIETNGNIRIGDSWEELDIDIPSGKYGLDSFIKIRECPVCLSMGKKHNDSSLSVKPAGGRGKCHKCGTVFVIRGEQKKTNQKNSYTPPSKKNLSKLSDEAIKYLESRRITQDVAIRYKLVERDGEYIGFPYFFNGEVVNIKFRGIGDKKFTQSPNGMHIVYNYDGGINYTDVIIVEGEMDVLSFAVAGFDNAVSVDSGAPNPQDKNIDKKLECITNAYDLFEEARRIYIAVDNDQNGAILRDELIRRFEFDKVRIVNWGADIKDANDCLMWEGVDGIKKRIDEAKELTFEGVYDIDDAEDMIWKQYDNGLKVGQTTHHPSIDMHWKLRGGDVTVATGYNNEGKSNLINNIALCKAIIDDWPIAVFSPENFPPEEFYDDMIQSIVGTTTDKRYEFRASREMVKAAIDLMRKKFFLVYPKERHTLEELLNRFDYLVRRHGVRMIIFDPYNQIDHVYKTHETIDLYVSRFMSEIKRFAMTRDVVVVLVAHQNPPKTRTQDGNYPKPDLYSIKNGGTLPDKADHVISIWRPYRLTNDSDPTVIFTSHKIKKKKLIGNTGEVSLMYEWKSNRYLDAMLGNKSPLSRTLFNSL